jgi:hypothetical protein
LWWVGLRILEKKIRPCLHESGPYKYVMGIKYDKNLLNLFINSVIRDLILIQKPVGPKIGPFTSGLWSHLCRKMAEPDPPLVSGQF